MRDYASVINFIIIIIIIIAHKWNNIGSLIPILSAELLGSVFSLSTVIMLEADDTGDAWVALGIEHKSFSSVLH